MLGSHWNMMMTMVMIILPVLHPQSEFSSRKSFCEYFSNIAAMVADTIKQVSLKSTEKYIYERQILCKLMSCFSLVKTKNKCIFEDV